MVTIIFSTNILPFSAVDTIQNAVTHRRCRGHAGRDAVHFVVPAELVLQVMAETMRADLGGAFVGEPPYKSKLDGLHFRK